VKIVNMKIPLLSCVSFGCIYGLLLVAQIHFRTALRKAECNGHDFLEKYYMCASWSRGLESR